MTQESTRREKTMNTDPGENEPFSCNRMKKAVERLRRSRQRGGKGRERGPQNPQGRWVSRRRKCGYIASE